MWCLVKLAVAALCGSAIIVLVAYFGQRKLIYFPDRTRVLPAELGLADVAERVLKTPDGEQLIVWYAKAKPGQPTLLYFHGNGGALRDRAERIRQFMAEGWGVYMLSYRGYSGSTGTPTEVANVADARLAYGALLLEGVTPEATLAYGESLGSNVAARIAVERRVGGLILEAPYTSIAKVGRAVYPYLPVDLLLIDRYDTERVIPQVRVAILIMHGALDRTIPLAMGQELRKLATAPAELVVFPHAGHNNLYAQGNDALGVLREWIRGLAR
jgi:pimeloyl-ACP methyl ester carboxylesterase